MKTTTTSLLLLFFLFSTKSCLLGVTNAENQAVLDIDGDEVRSGTPYYMVASGVGGYGFDVAWTSKQVCPKFITESVSDNPNGLPIKITPFNTDDDVIKVSSDVNIEFVPGYDAYCRSSTTFQIDCQAETGDVWLYTGGRKGFSPRKKNLNSWFKFEKADIDMLYKFKYCPSVCDSCVTFCADVELIDYQGSKRRLGLAKESEMVVEFVKAPRPFSAIKQVAAGKEPN